jgi:GDP-L-fucose synthase
VSIDLRDAKVLVTGGNGFLGRHLCKVLNQEGADVRIPAPGDSPGAVDLTNRQHTETMFRNCVRNGGGLDYVFHLAGHNGGIAFNETFPADIFFRNTLMGLNVLDACRRWEVKKVVSVVASCAYPEERWADFITHSDGSPMRHPDEGVMYERTFLDGPPHGSVACHGYAKRNLQLASSYYRQQYGLLAVCACPTTLYGPGDSYDPKRTKVMGGMVKRFCDAVAKGEQEVTCWGSGQPLREFVYVEDCARLLVETMLRYDDSALPLNLGTGQELSVKEVAESVAAAADFTGIIRWDTSKPDGQMRKRLDTTRMEAILPPFDFTLLSSGIRRTVEDYRSRTPS